jgi:serine/threonine protein kinase
MARELSSNQEALARFHREAEITSHLGHPHLVNVIDFGTAESGEPYLVMEYLEGEDLEHRLLRIGRLGIEAAVHITKQAASALGAAHAKDVVHRDLKPANIFLMQVPGEPDFVKVLDFGISKVKAARARLTRATAVVGTPNYMSPEQASGRVDETDHRADQWALACIVWEMLTGRTPFVADDVSPLFYQITNLDPPSILKHAPDAPPAIEAVLWRALAKQPAERYESIREFSRAFEEAALGRPADATPTPVTVSAVRARAGSGNHRMMSPSPEGAMPDTPMGPGVKPSKKLTTFSHTTGEVTQQLRRRRLRPIHLVAVAASLVVVMGVVMFFSGTGTPPQAVPTQSPSSPTVVEPLPGLAPKVEPAPPPAPLLPAVHPVKPKAASDDKKAGPPDASPKRKGLKSQPKRRIFQTL